MSISEPTLTVGIEEEYLIVDKDSRDLASEGMEAVFAACEDGNE